MSSLWVLVLFAAAAPACGFWAANEELCGVNSEWIDPLFMFHWESNDWEMGKWVTTRPPVDLYSCLLTAINPSTNLNPSLNPILNPSPSPNRSPDPNPPTHAR